MTDTTETANAETAGAPASAAADSYAASRTVSVPYIQRAPGLAAAAVAEPVGLRPACGGSEDCGCGCGGAKKGLAAVQGYVYAIGDISARFPNQSLEQEFRAVANLRPTAPISSTELYRVLSQAPNIYIARDMCWVMKVDTVDVYLVGPRSFVELSDLIMALQPNVTEITHTLVVGTLGPIAPPELCNGLQLPVTTVSQVYHFSNAALIESIREHAKLTTGRDIPEKVVRDTLAVLQQLGDNTGQTDEYRAINFMTVRSLDIYVKAAELFEMKPPYQISSVSAQPSQLSGTRRLVDVIFVFNNTVSNEVKRYFARVDVTGLFPFLASPVQEYYEHP